MKTPTWSAPSSIAALDSSTWHIEQVEQVEGRYQAGHFHLTGWGGDLDARVVKLPTGRTPGRALRSFRRYLNRHPVEFKY